MPFPKTILIYECDRDGNTPIYAVATEADDIQGEFNGVNVGVYELLETKVLDIEYRLLPKVKGARRNA